MRTPGAIKELLVRVRTCWFILRGHAVIKGVTVTDGIVDLTAGQRPVHLCGGAFLTRCEILTPGPAIVRVARGAIWSGNTGDALDYPGGVEYR